MIRKNNSKILRRSGYFIIIFLLGLAFGFLLPLAGFRLAVSGLGFRLPSLGVAGLPPPSLGRGLKPPTGLFGPIRVCGMAITSAQGAAPKETILIRVRNSLIIRLFFILIFL